jgi:hypothetical protein
MTTELDKPRRADPVAAIATDLGNFLWQKGYGRNCVNCDHFKEEAIDGAKDYCGMWNSEPPAKVIVVGCDKHTDLLPF